MLFLFSIIPTKTLPYDLYVTVKIPTDRLFSWSVGINLIIRTRRLHFVSPTYSVYYNIEDTTYISIISSIYVYKTSCGRYAVIQKKKHLKTQCKRSINKIKNTSLFSIDFSTIFSNTFGTE